MALFGIDISAWQRGLNLAQAKAEGVSYVIIKFGGNDAGRYKDSQAETFYKQCEELGLPVGAYYFGKCTTEEAAIEEARHFLSLISGKKFPCKVWYDIEGSMGSLTKENLNRIAKAFCKTVNDAGYDCGVYANASTFNKIDFDGSFGDIYPKWVASWGKTKPASVREGRDMWQYGGETNLIRSNKIAGKTVDQDYCYFEIGSVTPVPVPTPTPAAGIAKPTLKKGSKGTEVKLLQQNLMAAGFKLPKYGADGDYGTETANAVKALQEKAFVNSIYDDRTSEALKQMLNK